MINYKLITTFFLLILAINISAQKTTFDIIAMDKNIGSASIDKKETAKNEYFLDYKFDAVVKFLFIKTTVDMDMNVSYKNGQMVKANFIYAQNDKQETGVYSYSNGIYNVKINEKESTFTKKVIFTVMNLYEKEPVGIKEIFLEKQNEFVPIKNLGNHKYLVKVDGDDCTYTYVNGKVKEIFIDAIIDFTLIRTN